MNNHKAPDEATKNEKTSSNQAPFADLHSFCADHKQIEALPLQHDLRNGSRSLCHRVLHWAAPRGRLLLSTVLRHATP